MFCLMPTRPRVYLWGHTTDHYSLGSRHERRGNCQAYGLGRLVVDHQLERCWLLDRKVPWFRSLVRRTYRSAAEYNDAAEPIAHDLARRSFDDLVGTGQH